MQDRQFSDVSSHGTYGQPPMSHEAYGMREMGHGSGGIGPGEIFVDPYKSGGVAAAAAGAGAAGIGVARARSTKDVGGGAYAQALNDGSSPYPALAAPSTNGPPQSQQNMPVPMGYGTRGAGSRSPEYGFGKRSPEYELLEAAGMGGIAGGAAGMLARSQSQQQQQQRQYHYQRNQEQQDYGASLGRSPTSGSQYYPPPAASAAEYYPPPQGQGQGQGYGGFVQPPSQQQQQRPRLDPREEEGDMDDAYGGYEEEGDADQQQHTTVESHERGKGSLPNPFDAAHSAESHYDDDDEEEEEERGRRVLKVRFFAFYFLLMGDEPFCGVGRE
jgi:hypothetical protein